MKFHLTKQLCVAFVLSIVATGVYAADDAHAHSDAGGPACEGFGPQTPRDIDNTTGLTTGPKYTESTCSPLQVTWSVRPKCAKLDINSLGAWCENNEFKEDHAHGVRKLVTNTKLLSKIK